MLEHRGGISFRVHASLVAKANLNLCVIHLRCIQKLPVQESDERGPMRRTSARARSVAAVSSSVRAWIVILVCISRCDDTASSACSLSTRAM